MLQAHSSILPRTLTEQSHSSFTFFTSPLPPRLSFKTQKPLKLLVRCTAADSETLPKSAIRRIADKLRSLGFVEESLTPRRNPESDGSSSAGEIFVPLPKQLPKRRVGHTIDRSWSTPENPVPEPGTGSAIWRLNELSSEVEEQRRLGRRKREERVPTLAELSLCEKELSRLRGIAIGLKKKVVVGKAGITEGIVNTIHEQWRRTEVVKIACEDLCRLNMKRTHDLLECKTGGMVVWRSGTKIALYRGPDYRYPYFFADESQLNGQQRDAPTNLQADDGGNSISDSSLSSIDDIKSDKMSSTHKMAPPAIIRGVGLPNRVRFQLPGEAQLADEADCLLEGLGPRFTDWWGYDPLPVDADLLPAIIPGYRRPFRLLPYGMKPKLTNDEMTILRRLARPLPCHFALGRNRKLQGLAASILKLWEKCEVAKIAIKRGVQNTNSEIMAQELQWLTGGTLLSRDREFIVLYRGKDFLPLAVSSAIEDQRNHIRLKQRTHGATSVSTEELKPETDEFGPKTELSDLNDQKKFLLPERKNLTLIEAATKRTGIKLSIALEKKAKAEKLLAELENEETTQEPEIDKEGITEEERFMLRKVGLKMKPFLLLGKRGVFDGTVENMHLHWKYRELVKIISQEKSIEMVHQIAHTLEAESGGILVAVERVNKGFAIIVYRGKNYRRPSCLRPLTLLNKKAALRRSIEAQRRESLKLHVLKLTENIEGLKLQLDKEEMRMPPADDSRFQLGKEEMNVLQSAGSLRSEGSNELLSHSHSEVPIHSSDENSEDKPTGVSSSRCGNEPAKEENDTPNSVIEEIHASMDGNTEAVALDSVSQVFNFPSEGTNNYVVFSPQHIADREGGKSPAVLGKHNSDLSVPLIVEKTVKETPQKSLQLSNKERLLLRKQALKMKKRPVLAVGKSNIVTGVAKAIKAHFQKHPLAIVNVKNRAKGTSVQEVIFKLEQATGGVLVSQEPSKVILYRGWGAEEKPESHHAKKKASEKVKEDRPQPAVSAELLEAIRLECGLHSAQKEEPATLSATQGHHADAEARCWLSSFYVDSFDQYSKITPEFVWLVGIYRASLACKCNYCLAEETDLLSDELRKVKKECIGRRNSSFRSKILQESSEG